MKLCCAALWLVALAAQSASTTIEGHYFLGQAYPSGNVYLVPLSDEVQASGAGPGRVSFVALPAEKSAFDSRTLEAILSSQTLSSDYIPAIEGMDDEHRRCGEAQIAKKDTAFHYSSADFFETLADWCNPTENVSRYRSTSSQSSVMVFAFTDVRLTNIRAVPGPRPLTPDERMAVARDKAELAKVSECTTEPVFLDSAERILEGTIADNGVRLRLSHYRTPGCLGHFATVYILDFLQGETIVRTLQLHLDQGRL